MKFREFISSLKLHSKWRLDIFIITKDDQTPLHQTWENSNLINAKIGASPFDYDSFFMMQPLSQPVADAGNGMSGFHEDDRSCFLAGYEFTYVNSKIQGRLCSMFSIVFKPVW